MPCDVEGHVHEWATEGVLYIQKCERICQFCEEETGERKEWQYPWFLRRHIRGVHGKQFPKLVVSQDWRPIQPATPDQTQHKSTSKGSGTPQNKRGSPHRHDASPTKRVRVMRRQTREETSDTEISVDFDSDDTVEDAATDDNAADTAEQSPSDVVTTEDTSASPEMSSATIVHTPAVSAPVTPSPNHTRMTRTSLPVLAEELEALRMRLYRIGIDPDDIPNHPVTIVPAHDTDPAPYVVQHTGQSLEDANARFRQTLHIRMAYSDALLSLEYQGYRAGLSRYEMGIMNAAQVDKMLCDHAENGFCAEHQLPSSVQPEDVLELPHTLSNQSSPDIVGGHQLPPYQDPFSQPRSMGGTNEHPLGPSNTPFQSPQFGGAPLPELLTHVLNESTTHYDSEASTIIGAEDETTFGIGPYRTGPLAMPGLTGSYPTAARYDSARPFDYAAIQGASYEDSVLEHASPLQTSASAHTAGNNPGITRHDLTSIPFCSNGIRSVYDPGESVDLD